MEVLEAEAILGLVHWWTSLGLDRRTRHVLMRASFEPEKVEMAARIGGRIEAAFLGQEFDLGLWKAHDGQPSFPCHLVDIKRQRRTGQTIAVGQNIVSTDCTVI